MVKILICDDSPVFAARLADTVERYFMRNNLDYSVRTAKTRQEISRVDPGRFDLFFLDVEMGEENGIDLGKKIRKENPGATIVYVSAYHHYAISGYKVRAYDYILKSDPNFASSLSACLDGALAGSLSPENTLAVKADREYVDVPLREILYIEADKRKVIIHTYDNIKYETYAKISDINRQLCDKGFLQIQKSYIINLKHTRKISGYRAYMDDGRVLKTTTNTDRYTQIVREFVISKGRG